MIKKSLLLATVCLGLQATQVERKIIICQYGHVPQSVSCKALIKRYTKLGWKFERKTSRIAWPNAHNPKVWELTFKREWFRY